MAIDGNVLYVGGQFSTINSISRTRIATLDKSSCTVYAWNLGTSGAGNQVYEITVGPSSVFLGGSFTSIGGQPRTKMGEVSKPVDAVTATATVSSWNVATNASAVHSLTLDSVNGIIYVGAWSMTTIGGQNRNALAAVTTSGAGTVTSFNAQLASANVTAAVYATELVGTTLYISGTFHTAGGQARNNAAAIDTSTSLATSWNPNVGPKAYSLALSGTNAYIGGEFISYGGYTRQNAAAINPSTGQATSWNPNVDSIGGGIYTIYLDEANDIAYLGGEIYSIQGQTRNHIGAVKISDSSLLSWNPNANSMVYDIKKYDTTVYVAGDFTSIGGQTRNSVAALNESDGLATTWNPNVTKPSGPTAAYSLVLSSDGSLIYIGGNFTLINAQTRNYGGAVNTTTGVPTAWNPNLNGEVLDVKLDGSTVYLGGYFTTANGGTARNRAAAFDTSGTLQSWNPNITGSFSVRVEELLVDGNDVYLMGNFEAISGQARKYGGAVHKTTAAVQGWNPDFDNTTNAVTRSGSSLFIGGDVWLYDNTSGIRKYQPNIMEFESELPVLNFQQATLIHPESAGTVFLTIETDINAPADITFDYTVTGGSATSGSDFVFASGSAGISTGTNITYIGLDIVEDSVVEDYENILITLSNVTNATLGSTSTMSQVITDNDIEACSNLAQYKVKPESSWSTGSATETVTFDSNVSDGSLVIVAVSIDTNGNVVSGVTDNKGNSYTKIASVNNPAESWYDLSLWYAENVTGGSNFTVTATADGANSFFTIAAHEYTGMKLSGSFVVENHAMVNGGSRSNPGSVTLSGSAGRLLFTAHTNQDYSIIGGNIRKGFDALAEVADGENSYPLYTANRCITSGGTYDAPLDWDANLVSEWSAIIAAFDFFVASTPTPTPTSTPTPTNTPSPTASPTSIPSATSTPSPTAATTPVNCSTAAFAITGVGEVNYSTGTKKYTSPKNPLIKGKGKYKNKVKVTVAAKEISITKEIDCTGNWTVGLPLDSEGEHDAIVAEISQNGSAVSTSELTLQIDAISTPIATAAVSATPTVTPTLSPTPAPARVEVKITVVDKDKTPIVGAVVEIKGTSQRATTDKTGVAVFRNIVPGNYTLVVAYQGKELEDKITLENNTTTSTTKTFDYVVELPEKQPSITPWWEQIGPLGSIALTVTTLMTLFYGIPLLKYLIFGGFFIPFLMSLLPSRNRTGKVEDDMTTDSVIFAGIKVINDAGKLIGKHVTGLSGKFKLPQEQGAYTFDVSHPKYQSVLSQMFIDPARAEELAVLMTPNKEETAAFRMTIGTVGIKPQVFIAAGMTVLSLVNLMFVFTIPAGLVCLFTAIFAVFVYKYEPKKKVIN
jgi:hypothetical protein